MEKVLPPSPLLPPLPLPLLLVPPLPEPLLLPPLPLPEPLPLPPPELLPATPLLLPELELLPELDPAPASPSGAFPPLLDPHACIDASAAIDPSSRTTANVVLMAGSYIPLGFTHAGDHTPRGWWSPPLLAYMARS